MLPDPDVLDTILPQKTENVKPPLEQVSFGGKPELVSTETEAEFVQTVKTAFGEAMACIGKLPESVLAIEGMSGKKYRYFINNLIQNIKDPRYVEVGSWGGSTFCSAIYKNKLSAAAIDNWSQAGGPIGTFFKNVSAYCSRDTKISVLSKDFREVNFALLGKFNVYLFDGPHAYKDQYDGLSLALPCLDDVFVFIVDDWNWFGVRSGTMKAIEDLQLSVLFSAEIRTTLDNSHPQVCFQDSDWHNGYFIGVVRKPA